MFIVRDLSDAFSVGSVEPNSLFSMELMCGIYLRDIVCVVCVCVSALCVCVRGLCCLALRCARGSHVHLHACFSTLVCSILQTCQEARLRLVTVLTCRSAYTKSAYCVFTVSCVLDTPHTVHYTLHAISGPRAVMYHACIMHPPCTHRERNTSF